MTLPLKIDNALKQKIYQECQSCYPEEACGFLLGVMQDDYRIAAEFVACENIQNQWHEKHPERYPRDAKTAYLIDPQQQKKVQALAEQKSMKIIAIVHSHPEHDAYFSKEDKENAAPWGEPLFPDLSYVVVSLFERQIKSLNDFYWDSESQDFLEQNFSI